MNDDWRLRIDLHEEGVAHALTERLEAAELEHDLADAFHDRVIVSVDGPVVFCYAATREQAESAEAAIRTLAGEHGWHLEYELEHWHPMAGQWQAPDVPLPRDDAERAAEHRARIERERVESQAQGRPEFEVRVQCQSAEQSAQLAQALRADGIPTVQRASFVLAGAADEDAASELAERIRARAPAGCVVTAEASLWAVADAQPSNPFAVFGGLAG